MAPSLKNDDSLVAAALQGNEAAFQQLMEHYQDYIFGLCFRVCRNRADAEEVTQESFLSFYQHLNRYQPGGKLSNWLYTIALNKCRQRLRRAQLRRVLSLDFSPEGQAPLQVTAQQSGPEDSAAQAELRATLAAAADRLPAASRELYALRYDLDLEIPEIVAISGKRPEAVRVALHRARILIREALKSKGFDVTAWGLEDRDAQEPL